MEERWSLVEWYPTIIVSPHGSNVPVNYLYSPEDDVYREEDEEDADIGDIA